MTQIPTWSGEPASPPNGRAASGTTIGGRYSLRSAVGHGGMGTVWRAADTLLRRDVAVKEVVLPEGLAPSDREAMYERTLREARAAAALQHPAVVQVYDVVHEGGRPWIVMELLEARSLADIVIEDGPLAPRAVAKIGIALLGALEVAHAHDVLHRDVKPANVLICSDGRCVLTDFGVARIPTDVALTTPGMVLGSPHFISPERAMGRDFGPPSDLFSLGVTLYTAVEGRPPFDKGDPIETMHAVVEDPPLPTTRSGPLTPVLMGLLEKDPAQRWDVHRARAMLRELLAGPLASKAAVNTMTDPYAVVPAQRSTAAPTPVAEPPKPASKVGGRAMLAPGESLTDRLAALSRGEEPTPATAPRPEAALDETNPNGPSIAALETPTGAMPAPASRAGGPVEVTQPVSPPPVPGLDSEAGQATQRITPQQQSAQPYPQTAQPTAPYAPPQATQPYAAQPYPPQPAAPYPPQTATAYGAPGAGAVYGAGPSQWPAPGQPQQWTDPAATMPVPNGPSGSAIQWSQHTRGGALGAVKNLPRSVQLTVVGALAMVLVAAIVVFSSGSDSQPPAAPPSVQVTQTPAAQKVESQEHSARGVSVMVPKGWKKASGGSYTDYIDPEDSGRKVRILIEKFGGDSSMRWAEIAEKGLKTRASCVKPYRQLAMNEVELAGKPAAEFEYTCGEGDDMRHGVWRGVVYDGKSYSFYLTSTDARFAESKAIFDEMVRSFQLTNAE